MFPFKLLHSPVPVWTTIGRPGDTRQEDFSMDQQKHLPVRGKYRHFKGMEYEVVGIAHHSETMEDMVVYRALYGAGELWVRPASMWDEEVVRDGVTYKRFTLIEEYA